MASFEQAGAVRDLLEVAHEANPRFAGAGIAESDDGEFSVVLNFRSAPPSDLPKVVNKVPVKTSVVRPAAAGPLRRRR